ncbi:MAG TPA: TonB-dependent receptor, partial [Acidobacteriaceae bacterium]|nr:TonB-dependent receptor [Acidobacteriaceae bacterium]
VDDDAILSLKKHLLKFGTQLLFYSEHNQLTTNFNGTYTFGGGLAPLLGANSQPTGASDTITGLEQYRRAVLHLPGGAPTAFSNVAGTPRVDFTQLGDSLFFQDDWKLRPNLHIAMGMRYFLQNNPNTYNGATPRLGISWSPDKKATWNLHGHAGLFTGRYAPREWNELLRMDGVHRITSTVYNPSCAAITAAAGCDPFAGATSIRSLRTTSPHLSNISFAIENVGFTKSFPHGWNLSGDAFIARIWNFTRSRNINTPFNGSPTGPRPGPANLNILQMDNSGQGGGNAQFASLEQHSFKRIQFMMGVVRVDIFDDTNDSSTFTPQSAYTNAGEFARRTDNPLWNLFGSSTVKLPLKLQLNDALNMSGAATYNITTGFDNNGDGEFNDRPGYAAPGDPNAMSTRFGRLVNTGGIAPLPRNKGIMPWTAFLNANLQRTFTLSHNAKADHQQTLVANIRSVNALNHTNVKQVGGVLGSPLFGIPYAADTGRHIEAGLRYSF